MPLLLQISDPHFGTETAEVAEALKALSLRERPDVVVWSGDITQRARRAQFDAARRFHEVLGIPRMLCIPGNHDIPLFNLPARVLNPYGGFRRVFGSEADPLLSLPGLTVVGVTTTRPWRHKNGEVSRAQIELTSRRLREAAPASLRVVVVHQPLWVAGEEDRHNLCRGHEDALMSWAAAGADVVLSGHIHLPSVHKITVMTSEGERRLWNVQAGTAVSRRVRGGIPNSVNLIRHGVQPAHAGVIERWDFNAVRAAFEQAGSFPL